MLATLVFALVTASAPAPSPPPVVASPGLVSVEALAGAAAAYGEHLERSLGRQGVQVVPAGTLAARAGAAQWRAMSACDPEAPECRAALAELAGAHAVVTGVLEGSAMGLRVHVRILEAGSGQLLAEEEVTGVEREVLTHGLTEAAERLASQLSSGLGMPLRRPPSRSRQALVPLGVGIAAAGVSALFLAQASLKYSALGVAHEVPVLSFTEAQALRRSGANKRRAGLVFAGVASASLLGSLVLYYVGTQEQPGIITDVSVDPTQRVLVLSGVLP